MGTLQDQQPRNYYRVTGGEINLLISEVLNTAEKFDITFDQAFNIYNLAENRRRNDLFVANGDIWDEQICGIGDIFISRFNRR
jgi:hypothetical protein